MMIPDDYVFGFVYLLHLYTDRDYETKSDKITTSVVIPIIIVTVLLSGAVITVVVCVTVKKFQKQNRKRITAASGEMTIQSPNIISTTSPNDDPSSIRERKVKLTFLSIKDKV